MLKEVLLGAAVSRYLMGDKVTVINEKAGELYSLENVLRGFRFLVEEVPEEVQEEDSETEGEEQKPEEEPATSKKSRPRQDRGFVHGKGSMVD